MKWNAERERVRKRENERVREKYPVNEFGTLRRRY